LIYGVNLVAAAILAVPIFSILEGELAGTGFSADLARSFAIVVWFDIMESIGPTLLSSISQGFWMVTIMLVWKVTSHVGLIKALQGEADGRFWDGVERYTVKALGLAVLYLFPLFVIVMGVLIIGTTITATMGEVGLFWGLGVVMPTVIISLIALVDLMHDYSRIALVTQEMPVLKAWGLGIKWPFRHLAANAVYLFWFVIATGLWMVPFFLDINIGAATSAAMWGLLFFQQVFLLGRAAAGIGWLGSEVALFEEAYVAPVEEVEEEPEFSLAELQRPSAVSAFDDPMFQQPTESKPISGYPGGATSDVEGDTEESNGAR
jgi:hypothetical protein